ncbi:Large membrane protein OS=Streptomyces aurantiogriseus OX=66870 GN=GCM10010251_40520 PE=4 SV=1 [Streptomyces aurantiogriseus]
MSFTGGVCSTYKATAVESENEVKVTVTATTEPDKICILIAKVFHQTVQLDEPLGGRTVVGSDNREIPLEKPGARLPQ